MFKGFQLKNNNKRKLVESKAGDADEKDDGVEFKKIEIVGSFESTISEVEKKQVLVIPLPVTDDITTISKTLQSGVEADGSGVGNEESTNEQKKGGKYTSILMANVDPNLDDGDRFKSDILRRADDVDFKSEMYKKIPIEEFGAAMLRGMGWKDPEKQEKETESDYKTLARDPRLGLGAKRRDDCKPTKKVS